MALVSFLSVCKMAEGVTYFSTEEADTKYLNLFVISATSTLESGDYDNAPALYSHLGEAWHEAEQRRLRLFALRPGTISGQRQPQGAPKV